MLELVGFEQVGRPKTASNSPADCCLDRSLANPPAPAKVLNVKTYVLSSSSFLSDRTFDCIYYKTHIKAPLCSYHREALFFISILLGCLPAGKVGAYCGDLLGQVRAVKGGIRVKAVDHNTIIPARAVE